MQLDFITEAANVILVGPNGVGKSLIAQNLAHQAVLHGHSALFVNAAHMLGDLAAQDGDNALRRRFAHYARPDLLVIDEIGYLSYGTRHADLLFEIINRRYERKPTLITTNRPFAEWSAVFPNAACVVSIVDRLVHHAEILVIEGESFRMREARERAARRAPVTRNRADPRPPKPTPPETPRHEPVHHPPPHPLGRGRGLHGHRLPRPAAGPALGNLRRANHRDAAGGQHRPPP
jgi:hypothetical protein